MAPKIGSIVFSTEQGLGLLAKSFFDAGIVTDVVVLAHGRRKDHPEWYPGHPMCHGLRGQNLDMLKAFCAKMDAMLFFETPFDWTLLDECRRVGVPSILMTMYECMPKQLPSLPDHFWCPSELDLQYYPSGVLTPIPVDPRVEWKKRTTVKTFVHNMGHGGLKDRNGTVKLLESLQYLTKPCRIIVRSQVRLTASEKALKVPSHVELEIRDDTTVDFLHLYDEGEVFVFPEEFNGLSMPMQEAYASGMAVVGLERFPMTKWLDRDLLVRPEFFVKDEVSPRCNRFDRAVSSPRGLARKLDELVGKDVSPYSLRGREFGEKMSWGRLKRFYESEVGRVLD